MFIRSERLFLRPAWPEDAGELFAVIADEAVVRHLARVPWPYTIEDARAFVSRAPDWLFPRFLVTLPGAHGTCLIGGAGLHLEDSSIALGYWIAREHWGRGYATEAARTLVCLARTLGYRRLVADHFVDSPASGRVLCKAGFRPTGRTQPRHSRGRGGEAPSLGYAIALDANQGECNPGECDACRAMPQAA